MSQLFSEGQLGQLAQLLDKKLDKRFGEFEVRLDAKMDYQFEIVHGRIDHLTGKVDVLTERFDGFKGETSSSLDYLMDAVDRIEKGNLMFDYRLEARV